MLNSVLTKMEMLKETHKVAHKKVGEKKRR
jgi:hypothetical protein